jgi:sarcosine oxidase subunit alpha
VIAGSLNHSYALETVLADGRSAGARAAGQPGHVLPPDITAAAVNHAYPIWAHPAGDDYVDFDEDQTVKDLINAVADGFDHPELAKRYSTTAMGPSQGRMSATNALRIVVKATGGDFSDKAITTQRPPFRPVSFGLLAGRQFEPERLTAMHDWHVDNDAEMMPAGLWQRPSCYGADRDSAIVREVAAIRNGVGLIDVSTLGGIDVRGPDATRLLNRMYTLSYSTQPVGRTRYLLMTDDTGSIIDDGVAAHLGHQHFYITTTTTGSDAVYRTMLKRKQEWQLDVEIINLTSTLAAMNIAGPASRNVLSKMASDINFTKNEFPYLAVREGHINSISVRAMRVGFVGELGFELHVPRSSGLALWKTLMAAGEAEGIRPVGVEAQRILRLEKGHIIVGQDTDGLTSPSEAGMGWAVDRKKPYFVGRAALRCFEDRPLTRKLVGFELPNDTGTLPEECNLVIRNGDIAGRVTSIAHSAELNKIIGLAYVSPDDSSSGSQITIKRTDGRMLNAMVVKLPFLDPDGARQKL